MSDWTLEEEEAFNEVEKQSNLGKRILKEIKPQRTWVGLTDEDDIDWEDGGNLKDLVKAIEAKLKEKNNA